MKSEAVPGPSPRPRVILHMDLDAFFCSVEELLDPALKGTAFAVGAPASQRGVISTASYAARKFGVHSALPTARALHLCPGLVLLPGHYQLYSSYSEKVMAILADVTPDLEQVSIDEAFLDCTGDPLPGMEIGKRLRERIREETGLPCSIGIATNKLIAKIATESCKPDGLLEVTRGGERAFLAPLPIRKLWGVGPKTQAALEPLGIRTIGDLAAYPAGELIRRFGKNGAALIERAQGLDLSPVESQDGAKSVSRETTFAEDVTDAVRLRRTLREQADRVAAALRKENLLARTVRLKVRWPPFITLTRQIAMGKPTDVSEDIFNASWMLLEKVWREGKPVRLIGIGTTDFDPGVRQMDLFPNPTEKKTRKLEETIDGIRKRFGNKSVRRASAIKTKPV
jgi:DNA polymerase IV